jgi:SSS family solute:Na+ symporter
MDTQLFLACFFAYVIGTIIFGWWMTRKKQTGEDFLLAGRSLPLFLTLGTTLATMVGTGSSMGAVGTAYNSGFAGSLFGIGGAIGILLLAWLFAPVRNQKFMTMAEELSSYVGANRIVMNMVAVLTYLGCIGWLGAHILGGANYLQNTTGVDPVFAKVSIALGFGIYSMIGGYRAVVWTDSLQAIVLFAGFIATAFFAMQVLQGWDGLLQTNAKIAEVHPTNPIHNLSLVFAICIGVLGNPTFRQRIYSGNSVPDIRKAYVISGILYLGFAIIPSIIGMAAWVEFNGAEMAKDQAFPNMAKTVLPGTLAIIVLLAGLSATLSSASSDAISGVAILVRDIFKLIFKHTPSPDRVVADSRWSLVLTTGIALIFALKGKDIMGYIESMIAFLLAGMGVAGILGKVWPRYNAPGAICTMVAGSCTALYITKSEACTAFWGKPVIPTIIVAALAGIIVTLLTKPEKISQEEAADILAKERDEMDGA